MKNFNHHPDYDALPEPIKAIYTPKEYAWMPDDQRATLEHDECMPDWMKDEEV